MIRWWRANWGRLVGQAIAVLLAAAALSMAIGVLVGAVRAAIWLAGF